MDVHDGVGSDVHDEMGSGVHDMVGTVRLCASIANDRTAM